MKEHLVERFAASTDQMFIPKNPSEDERKGIEILSILKNEIGGINNGEEFYNKSGFKIFLEPLQDKLKDQIDTGFIEVSTLASTLHANSLDAFNIDFGNNTRNNAYLKDHSGLISQYFKPIIKILRKRSLILYNHPNYFINPSEILNVISIIPSNGQNIYTDIISNDTRNAIDNEFDSIKKEIANITNKDGKKSSQLYIYLDQKLQLKTRIRRSSIKDRLTSYDGITKKMPIKVLNKTNSVFKSINEKEKIFALHYLNHKLYHSLFQEKKNTRSSLFLSIPIIDPHPDRSETNKAYLGIGSVFIYLQLKDNFDPISTRKKIEEYVLEVPKIIRTYLTGYTFQLAIDKYNLAKEEAKNAVRQATKAAISQVMARNMSHNIGSHVLSKYKDVSDIKHTLYGSGKQKQYCGYNSNTLNVDDPHETIAYFNEYLKNRMDFLADIATTDPVMETPMYLFKDIIKGFDKNKILLDRISGVSEEIRFGIKVIVAGNSGTIKTLDDGNDPIFSIPNEVLGAQAFYILLENIIRNIYKHGNPTADFDIIIEIADYQPNKSFYEVKIYDSLCHDEKKVNKTVARRNKAFDDSILKDNKLRDNNLGTIEMDVCAAYLRCLPVISVENNKYKLQKNNNSEEPKLIYAYCHKQLTTNITDEMCYTLGYKFHINKPKEVLVLDETGNFKIGKLSNVELHAEGIKIVNPKELKEDKIYNHQIVYCTSNKLQIEKIITPHRSQISKRIVGFDKSINTKDHKKFIEGLWAKYIIDQHLAPKDYFIDTVGASYMIKVSDKITVSELGKEDIPEHSHKTIFLNHGGNYSEKRKAFDRCEIITSHNKLYALKRSLFTDLKKTYEYLETNMLKVLIIDERIQENVVLSDKKYSVNGEDISFNDYFQQQQIIIPQIDEANLNVASFGTISKINNGNTITEADKIKTFISKHLSDATFCVVHLGVLEKMLPPGTTKSKPAISKIIDQLFPGNKNREKLIVISGRGKPNNLSNDIPFISLALIQNSIETLFDKYLLTKILYNARKSA